MIPTILHRAYKKLEEGYIVAILPDKEGDLWVYWAEKEDVSELTSEDRLVHLINAILYMEEDAVEHEA